MHAVFVEAATGAATVSWAGSTQSHAMDVCAPGPASRTALDQASVGPHLAPVSDFLPLEDKTARRVTVSEMSDVDSGRHAGVLRRGSGSDRLAGILVHRLLQRADFAADVSDEHLHQLTLALISAVSSVELGDLQALIPLVTAGFRQIASRGDIRELYLSGQPYHEVPFTMQADGRIVRGTIDCLIAAEDRVIVLEFKTGRPRQEHQAQIEVYSAAARALFPEVRVESRLVYMSNSAGA
jgi:ATP-dependent exoDNAse (exonuclease V) beta subunit